MSVTIIICIITGLVSYRAFEDRDLFFKLKHYPYAEARDKSYYRFLSSMFVHGSWAHLLINLFVLYGFGQSVENQFLYEFGDTMGRVNFIILYLLSGVFADIPTFLKHKDNQMFSAVGASGAVSGILLSFVIFNPWAPLTFVFLPFITIPAIIMTVGYLAYSSWASKNDRGGKVDHMAHFYGAVFGFLFTIVLKPEFFGVFISELMNPKW